jgi:hypothetical protein
MFRLVVIVIYFSLLYCVHKTVPSLWLSTHSVQNDWPPRAPLINSIIYKIYIGGRVRSFSKIYNSHLLILIEPAIEPPQSIGCIDKVILDIISNLILQFLVPKLEY